MDILAINNVSKSFENKKIIDNVSFTIESGKIVGLLGKNGSGKTTILKMINSLLTIDEGKILVCGEEIGVKSKTQVSFLPERTYLESNQTVFDVFKFFETFYADFDKEKALELLEKLDLDVNASLSKMSKGMKEKLQLILVMSRKAKLYVLDEPLGGVDPSTRDYILQTILSNFDENSSLLITTHLISDIENILDEVVILDKGKIVLNGNADKLRDVYGKSINSLFREVIKW